MFPPHPPWVEFSTLRYDLGFQGGYFTESGERLGYIVTSTSVARGTQLGVKQNERDKKRDYTITCYPTTGRIVIQTSLGDEFEKHLDQH